MSGFKGACRLLPFRVLPADRQAAWTEALFACTEPEGPAALRWHAADSEALFLGRGQPEADANREACRAAGIRVHRRNTGGAAVLEGPNLLGLDSVLPAGHPLAIANVTESYRWLGEALAAGLRTFGVDAEAIPPAAARAQAAEIPRGALLRLACFATLSPYEVTVAGRKQVGLAQSRRRGGSLLQAGILLHWDAERLVSLLAVPAADRAQTAAGLRARAIGLDETGVALDRDTLILALTQAIAGAIGSAPAPDEWNECERAAYERALERDAPIA